MFLKDDPPFMYICIHISMIPALYSNDVHICMLKHGDTLKNCQRSWFKRIWKKLILMPILTSKWKPKSVGVFFLLVWIHLKSFARFVLYPTSACRAQMRSLRVVKRSHQHPHFWSKKVVLYLQTDRQPQTTF